MMMRILLTLSLLAVLAMPASAYVQPGHLPGGNHGRNDVPRDGGGGSDPFSDPFDSGHDRGGVAGGGGGGRGGNGEDDPTRPVPEPGTMALAAMGLAALGAASRRRRAS